MIAIFPEIAACVDEKDIEKLGILCRKYFCGRHTYNPKLDMRSVLEAVGLQVCFRRQSEPGMLCARDVKGRFQVAAFIDERLDPSEENFLMAHLLGHFLLHVQPKIISGDWHTGGLREATSPALRYGAANNLDGNELEEIADEFAAAFLLPKAMVHRASEKISNTSELAAFFGTTDGVMLRRLADCRRIPADFSSAESRIRHESDLKQNERPALNDQSKGSPLHSEQSRQTTSPLRTVAAATYKAQACPPQAKPAEKTGKGMARLREIAKELDRGFSSKSK